MADLQAEVQVAADEMVAAGTETGLQIAVHRYGRVVADVVSGVADAGMAAPAGMRQRPATIRPHEHAAGWSDAS